MRSPCFECGEPTEASRCPEHRRQDHRGSATERGYDAAWHRLSKRARKVQPWCSDCYTTDDLTTDHSPEAWARKQAGKGIRLRDVDVLCRSCNAKRGRARPRGEDPSTARLRPSVEAKSRILSTSRQSGDA